MTVEYFEYKGIQYPTRLVYLMNVAFYGQCEAAYVAETDLWDAIEEDVFAGVVEAVDIDNSICFYFEPGFLDGEPTEEEIVKRLKEIL